MKKYHIGLDFGTMQTKVCVNHVHLEPNIHEFFKFSNGAFFLPSRVGLKSDGTLVYGSDPSVDVVEEYYFFKIASADDEQFQVETYEKPENADFSFYHFNEFNRFSPELLSVVYLTHVLFEIKDQLKSNSFQTQPRSGFLGRFLNEEKAIDEEVVFTCQLGIPTEWSNKKNIIRKRKFENILILAELLQKKYRTKEVFHNTPATGIKTDISNLQKEHRPESIDDFNTKLNTLGLSVYPETAAGLTFIIKTRQIDPGYYATMDVGAGSTDVSFFKVLENRTIRYLASESFLVAANNVYQYYFGECRTIQELKDAETEMTQMLNGKTLDEDTQLHIDISLLKVNRKLQSLVKKLYALRVHPYKNNILQKYSNQPIIMYGGGSQLPIISEDLLEIFDNGTPYALHGITYLEKNPISRYSAIINISPEDNSWEPYFPMLVVALGLSYIKSGNSTDWFNDNFYHPVDSGAALVPHPTNEDRYIYDVLLSNWI